MHVSGQYYRRREDCMLHAKSYNNYGETETTCMCVKFLFTAADKPWA